MRHTNITHANEVISICDTRIKEIFSAGIPAEATERYERELQCMRETDATIDIYEYHVLAEAAKQVEMPLIIWGLSNDSWLSYLVGNDLVNPLKAYYYCTNCGHYERIPNLWYGADAPIKKCPKCNNDMTGEGNSLDWRIVWGLKGTRGIQNNYLAPPAFMPHAKRCLEEIYPQNVVVELGDLGDSERWLLRNPKETKLKYGFALLPEGKTEADYESYRENFPDGTTAYKFDLESENLGIFRILFDWIDPKVVTDIIWPVKKNDFTLREKIRTMCGYDSVFKNDLEEQPIFTSREALFRLLVDAGNDKSVACEVTEIVRKGLARPEKHISWVAKKWPDLNQRAIIPEDILKQCEKTAYLTSEGMVLALLKCNTPTLVKHTVAQKER